MLFHRQILLLLLSSAPSSYAFLSPRIGRGFVVTKREVVSTSRRFASSSEEKESSSSNDEDDEPSIVDSEEQLSQFEKDLLDAFGNEDNDGDAVTNAAFSAFARDLMNVDEIDDWKEWSDDVTDDDFLISADEAFDLYTETMDDLKDESKKGFDLNKFSVEVPEDEKQLVEDMVKSANTAIESIWGEKGMTNPVKDYFKEVKKQEPADDGDGESTEEES